MVRRLQFLIKIDQKVLLDPEAGKDGRQKEKREKRLRWLDSMTNSMDINLSKLREIAKGRKVWYAAVHGVAKSQTRLTN